MGRWSLFLAAVVAIGIVSSHAAGQPAVCEGVLQGAKPGQSVYPLGEPVDLVYAVRNPCDQPVIYTFSSAKQFDFWVKRGGVEIFRYSRGMMYAQVITSLALQPGETKNFEARWNQKDNKGNDVGPGVYEVYAQLTPMKNAPPAVKTQVRLGNVMMAVAQMTVREAIAHIGGLAGRKVQISGTYRGWQSNGGEANTKGGPPVTRSDWVICDATGCMYVTGPSNLDPLRDVGARITVVGKVEKTAKGQVYMVLDSVVREGK